MGQWIVGTVGVMATCAVTCAAHAQDQSTELAFMPATKTVTLLNEGGKYVAVDLKHIPEGGTCRMDKDATIFKIGPGRTADTIRVRYAAPQISSGGCPFLAVFAARKRVCGCTRGVCGERGGGQEEGRGNQEGSGRQVE